MKRKLFVNIAVQDLVKSRAFYASLGFTFNEQFCDDTAACLVLSEENYAMLLTHEKFRHFLPQGQDLCDTAKHNEVLLCISCESREEVDRLTDTAFHNGGECFNEPQDHGFMYSRSFRDPDGHVWEPMFMDTSALPA